jgi:solute carrier family 25 iron transporter 28/37
MVGHHPVEVALAGASATVAMDGILTPMDAVKQRMQLSNGKYANALDCVRKVRAREGLRSLYAGYGTTLVMNIPYHAFFFTSYETFKKLLGDSASESVATHLGCGAAAGMTAAALTNPLDVAKTRLQTQHDTGKRYGGLVDALRTIRREEGMGGLFSGLKPRIMLHAASSAIVWATYEYMKRLLAGDDAASPPDISHVHVHSL